MMVLVQSSFHNTWASLFEMELEPNLIDWNVNELECEKELEEIKRTNVLGFKLNGKWSEFCATEETKSGWGLTLVASKRISTQSDLVRWKGLRWTSPSTMSRISPQIRKKIFVSFLSKYFKVSSRNKKERTRVSNRRVICMILQLLFGKILWNCQAPSAKWLFCLLISNVFNAKMYYVTFRGCPLIRYWLFCIYFYDCSAFS